ncbi:MAG: head-tail connector protein, partial [Clostridium sp.]
MLLDKMKESMRVSGDFDVEIEDLIEACKMDLILAGIDPVKVVDTDKLIVRAITSYCKANFGYDNPESEKFKEAYESLKNTLSISKEYKKIE